MQITNYFKSETNTIFDKLTIECTWEEFADKIISDNPAGVEKTYDFLKNKGIQEYNLENKLRGFLKILFERSKKKYIKQKEHQKRIKEQFMRESSKQSFIDSNVEIFTCPIAVDVSIPKDLDGNPIGLTRRQRIEICKDLNVLKDYAQNRKSRNNQYRIAAAKALSTIYTKEAGDILRYLVSDPDWQVKKSARKYLEKRNNEIKQTKISNGTWVE